MTEPEEDKVPLFGNWRGWYVLVIAVLVILIVLFYLLTQYFK